MTPKEVLRAIRTAPSVRVHVRPTADDGYCIGVSKTEARAMILDISEPGIEIKAFIHSDGTLYLG